MNPNSTLLIRCAFIAFAVGMICLTSGLGCYYHGAARLWVIVLGVAGFCACVVGASLRMAPEPLLIVGGVNQNITLSPTVAIPREGLVKWDKDDPRVQPAPGIQFGTELDIRKMRATKPTK
jgi:hypothetical protein